MEVLRLGAAVAAPITAFESASATSVPIADGEGEAHVYWIAFEPGGLIGPHEAGFGQLFLPTEGTGWLAGDDGRRIALAPGEAAYIRRGETHSRGSDEGEDVRQVRVESSGAWAPSSVLSYHTRHGDDHSTVPAFEDDSQGAND